MKVMFAIDNYFAHYYINVGLGRALTAVGHDVMLWDINKKPAFDAFDEFEPNLFVGHTYHTDRAIIQCIAERPAMMVIMKASDYGDVSDKIDRTKYPVLIASKNEINAMKELREKTGKPDFLFIHYCEHRLQETHNHWLEEGFPVISMLSGADTFEFTNGQPRPEYQCDIGFVGGRWGYKSITLDKWFIPLLSPKSTPRVKIFGNQPWGVSQYCGFIADNEIKHFLASAKICPNLSEPHSQDFGYDIIERPFKLLSNKCFVISDYVEDLANLIPKGIIYTKTPQEFFDKIEYYLNKPEKRAEIAKQGYDNVMKNHTYFHRAAYMFKCLFRPDLEQQMLGLVK